MSSSTGIPAVNVLNVSRVSFKKSNFPQPWLRAAYRGQVLQSVVIASRMTGSLTARSLVCGRLSLLGLQKSWVVEQMATHCFAKCKESCDGAIGIGEIPDEKRPRKP